MDSSILLHTERRISAASADGIIDRSTRLLYEEFVNQKATYEVAKARHDRAAAMDQKDLNARLLMNESRRMMNVAETKLVNLSQSIAKALLSLRKSHGCIRRIDYRPSAA